MAKFQKTSTGKAQAGRILVNLFCVIVVFCGLLAFKNYVVDYAPNKYTNGSFQKFWSDDCRTLSKLQSMSREDREAFWAKKTML